MVATQGLNCMEAENAFMSFCIICTRIVALFSALAWFPLPTAMNSSSARNFIHMSSVRGEHFGSFMSISLQGDFLRFYLLALPYGLCKMPSCRTAKSKNLDIIESRSKARGCPTGLLENENVTPRSSLKSASMSARSLFPQMVTPDCGSHKCWWSSFHDFV